ncbi:hypothetical protein DFH07DRAFT_744411 [Mycena maculata]|uniref:Uncharacterized protein n=1 Tax=Mycena maculata TaxID=230809 RepID=A0AAD7J0U1_9AGAR|nr:hypothetical protein DFH07DRAFT_744411 [Mycena maculata]
MDKAIREYLTKQTDIPPNLCRLAREIPEFGLKAATTTRQLALHILWTEQGNTRCLYHHTKRGSKPRCDGQIEPGDIKIHGVPFSAADSDISKGSLHCGCSIDSGLWDLFLNKTMTIRSDNPRVVGEEFLHTNNLIPRHRAFFIQTYCAATHLTIDDLYSGVDIEYGTPEYFYRVQRTQMERLLHYTNMMAPAGHQLALVPAAVVEEMPVGA